MAKDFSKYQPRFEFAKKLAVECGQLALKFYSKCGGAAAHQGVKIDTKLNANDLVTEGDKSVEKFFISEVQKNYPTDKILGEESSSEVFDSENIAKNTDHKTMEAPALLKDLPDSQTTPIWIVDPIDGTMNFVHGFEFWCISIGCVVEGEIVFGVIFQITQNLMYSGFIGQGSFMKNLSNQEETKLVVSKQKEVKGSLVALTMSKHYLKVAQQIMQLGVHGFRAPGASALMCCDIAAGRCDFYSHVVIHAWDICAGIRIILEAGGVVHLDNFAGEYDIFSRRIGAAASQELARELHEKVDWTVEVSKSHGLARDILAWAN